MKNVKKILAILMAVMMLVPMVAYAEKEDGKTSKLFYKSKNFDSALKLTKPYVNISMVGNHEKNDNH